MTGPVSLRPGSGSLPGRRRQRVAAGHDVSECAQPFRRERGPASSTSHGPWRTRHQRQGTAILKSGRTRLTAGGVRGLHLLQWPAAAGRRDATGVGVAAAGERDGPPVLLGMAGQGGGQAGRALLLRQPRRPAAGGGGPDVQAPPPSGGRAEEESVERRAGGHHHRHEGRCGAGAAYSPARAQTFMVYGAAGGIETRNTLVPQYAREHAKLDRLRELAQKSSLTPPVARTLPAEQAPKAHPLLEAGGLRSDRGQQRTAPSNCSGERLGRTDCITGRRTERPRKTDQPKQAT